MFMTYSQELVDEYKKYMKQNHACDVTDEEAQEHLKNLSGLYIAFSKPNPPIDK